MNKPCILPVTIHDGDSSTGNRDESTQYTGNVPAPVG